MRHRAAAAPPEVAKPAAPAHSKKKRSAKDVFLDLLGSVIPKAGDSAMEIVRKCVFMVALLVLIGSVSYLLNDMVIQPGIYENTMKNIRNIYTPGVPSELPPGSENYPFPEGMSDDFKRLYMENNDLRGYLIYQSSAGLFNIEYPVLQSNDNDFYLNRDFYKKTNKQGALFFDYRNNITLGAKNKNLIIYGHNLSTGQMFTYLNKLITKPNKNYARSASTMTMNTIYEQATYKVFAVMVVNNDAADGEPFRYLRTDFTDDNDFLRFVAEIRARSVYDYDSVDGAGRTMSCSCFPPATVPARCTSTMAGPWSSPARCARVSPPRWTPAASTLTTTLSCLTHGMLTRGKNPTRIIPAASKSPIPTWSPLPRGHRSRLTQARRIR